MSPRCAGRQTEVEGTGDEEPIEPLKEKLCTGVGYPARNGAMSVMRERGKIDV